MENCHPTKELELHQINNSRHERWRGYKVGDLGIWCETGRGKARGSAGRENASQEI